MNIYVKNKSNNELINIWRFFHISKSNQKMNMAQSYQMKHLKAISLLNAYTKYCKEGRRDGKMYMTIHINNVLIHLRAGVDILLSDMISCAHLILSLIMREPIDKLKVKKVDIKTSNTSHCEFDTLFPKKDIDIASSRYDVSISDILARMRQNNILPMRFKNKPFFSISILTDSFEDLPPTSFVENIGFRYINDIRDIKKHSQIILRKDEFIPFITNEYGVKTEYDYAMTYLKLYGRTIEEEFLSIPLHPCIFDLLFVWGKDRLPYWVKRIAFRQYRKQYKEWMATIPNDLIRLKRLKLAFCSNMKNKKYIAYSIMKINEEDAAQTLRNINKRST